MQKNDKIKQDLALILTMAGIIGALEEVYVMKMRRIRAGIINARQYFNGVLEVFQEVQNSYRPLQQPKKGELAFLLSGNLKFAGEINLKVFNQFNNYIQKQKCDVAIAGRIGDMLYRQRGAFRKYQYFDLENEYPDPLKVADIVNYLKPYEKITVFYGDFINLENQEPMQTYITGNKDRVDTMPKKPVAGGASYIFEPNANIILDFFNNQIVGSLFRQTVYESCLAQLGSRIKTMEVAYPAIKEQSRILSLKRREQLSSIDNKKQRASAAQIYYLSKYGQ
jgi:F0F1-type ATP synthase gamma subunit